MDDELKKMQKSGSDLSDIVLEKSSKKTQNSRKWILTAAFAIILFLIVIILMKMLKQTDTDNNSDTISKVGESVNNIKSETTPQIETKDENLFKKEPIIEESSDTDAKFEEMVRRLKEQDKQEEAKVAEKNNTPTISQEKSIANTVKPSKEQTIQVPKEIPVITTPVITQPVKKIVQPSPKVIHETIKPVQKVSQPAIKHQKKSISKVFHQVQAPKHNSRVKGYFIQVGATSSFPDKRFLRKIKSAGFDYTLYTINSNGRKIKKILVGPFPSREAAKRSLPKAKSMIASGAYIYRVK